MNPSDQKWQRLAAAARRAPDSREVTAPYGFSTRVAAQAFAAPSVSLLERFSLRALGVAALLAVVCVAGSYTTIASAFDSDSSSNDDPVADVLELTS
ncbi:MAG TPA: hypothetical protein PLU52_05225 [Opitutaceae bacterium]|nr:hypothetical protein [Opitutaceae bacterium]HND60323.1 hypothetical protein [Opitutaceae bacterium]